MTVRSRAALRPAIQQGLKSLVYKFSWASLQKYGSLCMWQDEEKEKGSSVSGAVLRKTTLRRLVWKLYIKSENHSLSSLSWINPKGIHRSSVSPTQTFKFSMCNGPTNALVCNKTLIQMSHIKTLKITPTCFDHQLISLGSFLILVKITG
jgi:hypothetical protein